MEFRVVSLPPTINSIMLPRNSSGRLAMSLVVSPCASIVIRSFRPVGSAAARSDQSPMNVLAMSFRPSKTSAGSGPSSMPVLSGEPMEISDQ